MNRWTGALLFLLAATTAAQPGETPNAILLIAGPSLQDPNFRQSVVLVTQAADSSTVGVILNRPSSVKDEKTGEAIYFGGPVMTQVPVALFRSETVPAAAAFPVLKGVYLSMHPDNIAPLLSGPPGNYRIYSGFSGWAPRQLEAEMERDDWLVLPVTDEVVFRRNTEGLWKELLERAQARKRPHVREDSRRYTFTHDASGPRPPRPRGSVS